MSTVGFNPVINKKAAGEVTKVIKQAPGEMKPFPEMCKDAAKCKPQQVTTDPFVSPYAQSQTVAQLNKELAATAAKREYPPMPFN